MNDQQSSTAFPVCARQQVRNALLFAICMGLIYLAAPIAYVGVVQATLCNRLGTSGAIANLPNTAFYLAMLVPVVVTWRFHSIASIKPVLFTSFALASLAGVAMTVSLCLSTSVVVIISAVVAHSAIIGAASNTIMAYFWELLSRTVASERRGLALSLAFGIGPLLAVAGSMATQAILSGAFDSWWSWQEPATTTSLVEAATAQLRFALLFAATVPILGLAALLCIFLVVPDCETPTVDRPPLIVGLIEGARSIFSNRILRQAVIAYACVTAGSCIVNNMSLYQGVLTGREADEFAGYANALRFSFKVAIGLVLGGLLARTHAKLGVLVTSILYFTGIGWALFAPKGLFLICFGFMGGGDLSGVYYPNYVSTWSPLDRIRGNVAFLQLITVSASIAPAAFGAISDLAGFRTSFVVAGAIIFAAIVLVIFGLPAHKENTGVQESSPPAADAEST